MKHPLALWSQGFNDLSPLPSSPKNRRFHSVSNFHSATCHQGHPCNFLSFCAVVGPHLHAVQEKQLEPHQSVCQLREFIDWVHITLWTLQRASAAKPYRSATLYIIVPDAPWSGTVCCPASSIRAPQFRLLLMHGTNSCPYDWGNAKGSPNVILRYRYYLSQMICWRAIEIYGACRSSRRGEWHCKGFI